MRVLVIKTSSMGDVLHTLPAITDAKKAIPDIEFDWVVEESLQQIPLWHPAVSEVIPVALRRWRRNPIGTLFGREWRNFRQQIKQHHYHKVIDAQGLMKSAFLSRFSQGTRCGLDKTVARESLAVLAYDERHAVATDQHAITRVRQLFARCLGYAEVGDELDYGIDISQLNKEKAKNPYVVFLHGTTWKTKLWPEIYWLQLAQQVTAAGFEVWLPWGSEEEKSRAERIALQIDAACVLDRQSIEQMAGILSAAMAVVAVDTGLGHLCAALAVPSVTIYGATKPDLTGTLGANQYHLRAAFACSPCLRRRCNYRGAAEVQPACYGSVDPEKVWHQLSPMINKNP